MKPARRYTGDAGTSLMLMPAAILVVMLLGAIALDAAALRMQSRELRNIARSAANDALSAAVDVDHLRRTGAIRLDESEARSVVGAAISSRGITGTAVEDVTVTRAADGTVILAVFLSRPVEHVLRPPGTDPTVTLAAEGSARHYVE